MLPARKEEVFPVEVDSKKLEERFDRIDARLDKCEERLGGLEVRVAVLTTQGARLATDVAELKSDVKGLSTRMTDGFQSVHKELSSAKIWALFIAAAMLGVIARGFHWI